MPVTLKTASYRGLRSQAAPRRAKPDRPRLPRSANACQTLTLRFPIEHLCTMALCSRASAPSVLISLTSRRVSATAASCLYALFLIALWISWVSMTTRLTSCNSRCGFTALERGGVVHLHQRTGHGDLDRNVERGPNALCEHKRCRCLLR